MKTSTRVVIVTAVVAVLAFLSNSIGPLGGFWRPAPEMPEPAGLQRALFGVLLAIEGLAFGLGIAFLAYGYPLVRSVSTASTGLTRAAHVSFAWLLINWWAHDSLHLHNGVNLSGLLAIEFGFHFTIIVAGLVLLTFLLALWRNRTELGAVTSG